MKKSDFIFEKPEESTGFLLWQVTNLWQREIKKALEKYGLTHSQFVLLASMYWLELDKQKSTHVVGARRSGRRAHCQPIAQRRRLRHSQCGPHLAWWRSG